MVKDTDLHLYLETRPDTNMLHNRLVHLGFKYEKTVEPTKSEPECHYWSWSVPTLSKDGFRLLHFEKLFPDDLNRGRYKCFMVLTGEQGSSPIDLQMIDIVSLLLITNYGGRVHNPQRLDKISTSFLLSGKPLGAI